MRKLSGLLILVLATLIPLNASPKPSDIRQQCYDHVHDWLLARSIYCDTLGQSAAAVCLQNAVDQANLDNAVCDTLDN